jgi:hypothetical protein
MRVRYALFAFVIAACGGGGGGGDDMPPDAAVSPACMEATTYSNLANIEEKIFKNSCIFSGCHNGGTSDAGRIDLRTGMAFSHLVNFDAVYATGFKLVVPSQPSQSWLLVMIGQIEPTATNPPTSDPPATVGLMPQNTGGQLLCPEKRGAIQRWIEMGAQNN